MRIELVAVGGVKSNFLLLFSLIMIPDGDVGLLVTRQEVFDRLTCLIWYGICCVSARSAKDQFRTCWHPVLIEGVETTRPPEQGPASVNRCRWPVLV